MSYDVMLEELNENIIKTSSAKEALEVLLKIEVAVSVAAQHALVPA